MKVEFVDLKRQNRVYRKEFLAAVEKTITQADFILGKPLVEFERAFARLCHTKYCLGLNSGTDGLEFALQALGIGKGDQVLTPPNSYFSSAAVITRVGATPVFVDIDPKTHTLNPEKVKSVITRRTKAIMPVHLFGQAADMDPIITLAKKHKLKIIEDCAQAHGAKYKGKVMPVTGLGVFSFYPSKNLGAFGDGGALVTNSRAIYEKVLRLRNDGAKEKYVHELIGAKSRLDTLQAAVLLVKLKYLNRWNNLRRKHAKTYKRLLKDIPQVTLPTEAPHATHVYHLYVIEVREREKLQRYLAKHGIATQVHYPIPIHLQAPYRKQFKKGSFPITEEKARRMLSLPMFPEMTEKEVKYVASTVRRFYS